jgi:hypothetical protein
MWVSRWHWFRYGGVAVPISVVTKAGVTIDTISADAGCANRSRGRRALTSRAGSGWTVSRPVRCHPESRRDLALRSAPSVSRPTAQHVPPRASIIEPAVAVSSASRQGAGPSRRSSPSRHGCAFRYRPVVRRYGGRPSHPRHRQDRVRDLVPCGTTRTVLAGIPDGSPGLPMLRGRPGVVGGHSRVGLRRRGRMARGGAAR